jgi:Arc/MetJ family transcription regulator
MVADLLEGAFAHHLVPFRDSAKNYARLSKKTIAVTRWNSTYDVLCDVVSKKAEMNNNADHTSLSALVELLAPFAYVTDLLQADDAGLWHMFAAIQYLRDSFQQESADHQAVRRTLEARASMLISPALFVLAWMAPNLPRQQIEIDAAKTAAACHCLLLGKNSNAFVDNFRPAVSLEGINKADFLARQPQPTHGALDVEVDDCDANLNLARRLLSITPTEASVERVFSAIKINATRLCTRCNPRTAVAQVLYNVCQKFMRTVVRPLLSCTDKSASCQGSDRRLHLQRCEVSSEAKDVSPFGLSRIPRGTGA